MKYIFLDFDGVLHGEKFYYDFFSHALRFSETIKPFINNLTIIISSSWRETHTLEQLKVFFPKDIQNIILGVTPITVDGFNYNGRYQEILLYCTQYNIHPHQWIALDDMQHLFPENCENLILVNSLCGLTPHNLEQLTKFLIR